MYTMSKEQLVVCCEAFDIDEYTKRFGAEECCKRELDFLIEECAELIQSASKIKRDINDGNLNHDIHHKNNLVEEMGHVIMCIQICCHLIGIDERADIKTEIRRKCDEYECWVGV